MTLRMGSTGIHPTACNLGDDLILVVKVAAKQLLLPAHRLNLAGTTHDGWDGAAGAVVVVLFEK